MKTYLSASRLAPAILLLSFSVLAQAQGNQIESASYGARNQRRDVTSRVQSMARNGTLDFRVSNDALSGDPAPGQKKDLYMRVRDYRGRTQQYTYYEGDRVNIQLWNSGGGWNGGGGGNWNYQGRLRNDDQRRFDSYYTRWLDYTRTNNYSEIQSMEKRMRDIYSHYSIPYNTPWAAVASPGLGQPGNGWGGWNDLRITSATWGAYNRTRDVTGMLQGQVSRDGRLEMKVNNTNLGGDPAPGETKTLTVRYFYQGRQLNRTLREGDTLRLP
jgi:hypothetical protein